MLTLQGNSWDSGDSTLTVSGSGAVGCCKGQSGVTCYTGIWVQSLPEAAVLLPSLLMD